MDVLNLLVDFLVSTSAKVGESLQFWIVFFTFIAIKVYRMSLDFKLKKAIIDNTYDLSINDKKIVRYFLRGRELLSDNGESDLPHLSAGKNSSDGDHLLQDDDEFLDGKNVILFAKTASALKGDFMQNENKN